MGDLVEKKNILLGVTGSVAAYKSVELARFFVSRGYNVSTVMTAAACEFVTPVLFETITGRPALSDLFDNSETASCGHIELADRANVFVIAPATANMIAKLAHGIADCPVSTVALATRAPVVIAPAMNVNMLENPVTQDNMARLRERGYTFVDPENGFLACGWQGGGRLAEPWEIFHETRRAFSSRDFAGRNVLVSTGPTREAIDPVRFISNRSSGKMGVAIAREAYRRGAEVTLVHGPVKVKVPSRIRKVGVVSANEMHQKVLELAFEGDEKPDVVIMAAAVADFRPSEVVEYKIRKGNDVPKVDLTPNPDILADLGSRREGERPLLVGFAVETGEIEDLIESVRGKLLRKKADMIIGNFANEAFDYDTNRVWIIDKNGRQDEVATTYKSRVANKILDRIRKL